MKYLFIVLMIWCVLVQAQQTNPMSNRIYVRLQPEYGFRDIRDVVALPANSIVERRLLEPSQSILMAKNQNSLLSTSEGSEIAKAEEPLLRTFVIQLPGTVSPPDYCAQLLKTNNAVEVAIPIFINSLQFTPNDVRLIEQQYLKVIDAEGAWDITRGDSTLLIGVSDAGMRVSHEDLADNIALNKKEIPNNDLDDDNNGYIDDYIGFNFTYPADKTNEDNVYHPNENHGTKSSGLIGAKQNNNKGISGVAGICKLIPIKTVPNTGADVLYGYESLLYAAARGCKVVNCSWGNNRQAFNVVEQSIINYVVSKDVAIVVSAGNYGGIEACYPASYQNVLSVGETNVGGFITSTSNYGTQCLIMSPGEGALTTDNFNDDAYSGFNGTSSASPIVAGVVALVRSKFPTLTAMQALEQVRISSVDISDKNVTTQKLIPGMVNAKNAVTRRPFSTPSVRVLGYTLQQNSVAVPRGRVGDTLSIILKAKNYLGKGSNVRFALSVAHSDVSNVLNILDSVVTIPEIQTNEEFVTTPFRFVITSANTTKMILRVDITGKGDPNENGGTALTYTDFAKLDFFATQDYAILSNDSTSFSVGDYGWVGTNAGAFNGIKGNGFNVKGLGNLLYRAGLMVAHEPTQKIRTGFGSDGGAFNDFDVVSIKDAKPFMLSLIDTAKGTDKIGVEVEQQFILPNNTSTVAKVIVTLKNKNKTPLQNVSVGYFFDWDLTLTGDSSSAELFPEATIAAGAVQSVAELVKRTPRNPVVGAAALASGDVTGQAAGLNFEYISSFTNDKKIETLNKGTSIQVGNGDVSMVVGMKYNSEIQPEESKNCTICFGAASTRAELASRLYNCQLGIDVGVAETDYTMPHLSLLVHPQPAGEAVNVQLQSNRNSIGILSISTLTGEDVLQRTVYLTDGKTILQIPTSELAQGVYVVNVRSGSMVQSQLVTIIR